MARKSGVGTDRKSEDEGDVNILLRMIDGIHHRGERLESLDEQRVRLFLTLVSGSLALLAIAVQFGKSGIADWPLVSTVLFLFLLAFGFETLHSINWSRISLRENQAIEGFLLRRLASVNDVAAHIAEIQAKAELFKKNAGLFRNTVRGNLVEFMYLTNGLLMCGALFSLGKCLDWPAWYWPMWLRISLAFAVFVLLIILQYRYSRWIREVIPVEWVEDPNYIGLSEKGRRT